MYALSLSLILCAPLLCQSSCLPVFDLSLCVLRFWLFLFCKVAVVIVKHVCVCVLLGLFVSSFTLQEAGM